MQVATNPAKLQPEAQKDNKGHNAAGVEGAARTLDTVS
jgi:hypothetical protein